MKKSTLTQPHPLNGHTECVVLYATADFTDAPANYWDNLHVRSLDSLFIRTGNSIPAGNYRHTGKILPVGLWQRV